MTPFSIQTIDPEFFFRRVMVCETEAISLPPSISFTVSTALPPSASALLSNENGMLSRSALKVCVFSASPSPERVIRTSELCCCADEIRSLSCPLILE